MIFKKKLSKQSTFRLTLWGLSWSIDFVLGLNVGEPSKFQLFCPQTPTGGTTPPSWRMKHKVWLTTGIEPPFSSSGSKCKPGGHTPSSWRWRRLTEVWRDSTEWETRRTDSLVIHQLSCLCVLRNRDTRGIFSLPLFACVSQRWVCTSCVFWSYPTPMTPNLCVYREKGSVCSSSPCVEYAEPWISSNQTYSFTSYLLMMDHRYISDF